MSGRKRHEFSFSSSVALAMDYAYQLIHSVCELTFFEGQEEADWMNSKNDVSKNPFVISKVVPGKIEDALSFEDFRERDVHFFLSIRGDNNYVHVLTLNLEKKFDSYECVPDFEEYHENNGYWRVKIVKFGNFQDFHKKKDVLNNLPNEVWL